MHHFAMHATNKNEQTRNTTDILGSLGENNCQ